MSKVSLVKCSTYDQSLIDKAIRQTFANLGGIGHELFSEVVASNEINAAPTTWHTAAVCPSSPA